MELVDEGLAVAGFSVEAEGVDLECFEGIFDGEELFLELGEDEDAAVGGDGGLDDFEEAFEFCGAAGDGELLEFFVIEEGEVAAGLAEAEEGGEGLHAGGGGLAGEVALVGELLALFAEFAVGGELVG